MQPDCQTESGCKIPPLDPVGARIIDIRSKLHALSGLNIGPGILNIYNVTAADLDLLAVVENALKPQTENNNGNGSDMDTER